eukprot:TRINITY_DN2542_c0_g1::TRINITY_DN2542_c0_g1_i1::g.19263::m.19263 TRINITY_DN2542_c0_g1::TRINITY_DN2542_c0_g1_i1::g.19263  ORF type:complete len:607 (-),score=240.76,sp/P29341/PABP1_MOUSE/54.87/0.0,RRM_1/PF00076.17/4e-20,RRM_1/PF00076.17/1.5e-18,RRM_1/PF00076.17/9.5e-16,RRM_1/PF00076.17/5e-19,RRM_6/PF14259.1/4.8e-14,RRM_6/PF14259.1/4.5e-10,RRM_6/PF14259.1/1.1e-10,RRM_6/PF14259.1/7.7e-14,RRM_5/PF13893.1/3.7e-10,RRM_5/PF13893.1/5.5e-10,RRM_5/PF13893.1/6.7e-09,RRM_5/PF13893.1/1.4e-10,PABP/PF00658.13/2
MVNVPLYASASLYVGDLAPEVTEAILFEIFSQAGPVASIRVCRDAITRRSLGYAYVNFHNVGDAERALDTMNYTVVKGRPLRIMWSHRDPAVRKAGDGNIFIKSLEKSIDNKALYDTFSTFGNILSCKVAQDEKGNSRGYGFVHFETREAADTAIAKVNGMLLNDKKVFVGFFKKKEERLKELGQVGERYNNIYTKNFPDKWDDEQVKQLFAAYGEIISIAVQKDKFGRPFGFVSFKTPEAAKAAVDELNGKEIEGKPLFAGRAQKKAEREADLRKKWEELRQEREKKFQGVNLYVKNLEDTVDDDRLRKEFAPFGTITSSKIMMDENGRSRGFGFVCFSTQEEATRALTEMNGRLFLSKPLYVALAQRKEHRRAQLEAIYAQRQNGRMFPAVHGQPAPMYANQPVFYAPQPGMPFPPQVQRQFMHPQHMMPRPGPGFVPRQPQQPRPFQQAPPQSATGPRQPRRAPQGQDHKGKPAQGQAQANAHANAPAATTPATGGQQRAPRQQPKNNAAQQKAAAAPAQVEPLTASVLAAMPVEQQKQAIGERLFPLIHEKQPETAGKITGMLLEMENTELLHLLESPQALDQRISEALSVLEAHAKEQGQK